MLLVALILGCKYDPEERSFHIWFSLKEGMVKCGFKGEMDGLDQMHSSPAMK